MGEVFSFFFQLGIIAFGGPAAHIALMRDELVDKKKWMTDEEFLDYMGITNLVPGPNSTEMTMHCGHHRAGVGGLFTAGAAFIFPAVVITLLVAYFFEQVAAIDWVVPIINGIKAAVISFIIGAIIKLGKKSLKNNLLIIPGLAVLVASFFGVNEIICILTAGLIWMLAKILKPEQLTGSYIMLPLFSMAIAPNEYLKMFLIFLKVGAVLFGSGYVLFAYLDGELIDKLGWLTHSDLAEAIAIGQITPGPVLSTSTFIGYKLAGFQGAILSTLGIFLPSFFYILLLSKYLDRIKSNKYLKYFLEAVNVAAVAVMIAVSYRLVESIVVDWRTALIAIISFGVYFYFKKLNALWIILGGAIAGYLLSFV